VNILKSGLQKSIRRQRAAAARACCDALAKQDLSQVLSRCKLLLVAVGLHVTLPSSAAAKASSNYGRGCSAAPVLCALRVVDGSAREGVSCAGISRAAAAGARSFCDVLPVVLALDLVVFRGLFSVFAT
jgi:hypothetical protein